MSAHFAYVSSRRHDYGVLTADTFAPLALHGVAVDVELRGNCARVHVRYEYVNLTGRATRAMAVYALPAHWDLMSCRAVYGDDAVTAAPAAAAPLRLCAAAGAAAGHAVAAQPLPWPVAPGAAVVAAAVFHAPLDATRARGKVRVPLPAELFPPPSSPNAAHAAFNAAFDTRRPHAISAGWTIEARGDLFVPLVGPVVLAPSVDGGKVDIQYVGDSAFNLRFTGPLARPPAGGFALECVVRETNEPLRFFIARDEGTALDDADRYAIALSLSPQLEGRRGCDANAEIIFVVDAHLRGNMTAAAKAIRTALRSLPNTTRINVVLASDAKSTDGLCALFPSETISVLRAPIEEIAMIVESAALAPQGTCKLIAMLRAAAEQKAPCLCGPIAQGYVRHIVLLSDAGDATRGPELVAFAARTQRLGNVTFSAVALLEGGAVHVPLLELLAAEGGGAFCEANGTSDDAASAALVDVCLRLAVPTLTDIKVVFDESVVRAASGPRLPAIAQGTQRFVYCLAPASLSTIGVTATGRVGATALEYIGRGNLRDAVLPAASSPGRAESVGLLHLAAAAARLRWLVEAAAGGAEREREAARLSGAFMLLSPAAEMRQRRDSAKKEGEEATGDAARVAVRFVPRSATYAQTMQRRERERVAKGLVDRRPKESAGAEHAEAVSRRVALTALARPQPPREFIRGIVAGIVDLVMDPPNSKRLGALQHADGSFPLSATLAACVGIAFEQLERELQLAGFGISEDLTAGRKYVKIHERVWATAIAAAAMEREKSGVLALAYNKALKFMTEQDVGETLLRHAHDMLVATEQATVRPSALA